METPEDNWAERDRDMGKSFSTRDALISYTVENSLRLHPLQIELQENTLKNAKQAIMLGAPEVLQLGANIIQAIRGKKVLDVGTFTGASALAWALAVPADGQVITMDVSDENYKKFGLPVISKSNVANKIVSKVEPALKTLDDLIKSGQSGTFDFAFIDADKENYGGYYEKCLALLRPGGVIAVDNALFFGDVLKTSKTSAAGAIDALNKKIHKDERVNCSLLTTGDGTMLAFKK